MIYLSKRISFGGVEVIKLTESVCGLVGSETSKSMLKESCEGMGITKLTSIIFLIAANHSSKV